MTPDSAQDMIFDGAHLRATLQPGDRRQLIVTFDYRMDGKNDFTPAAHSTTFARQGLAQLSIKTRCNDWFINPDTAALEVVLTRFAAGYDRVHMLGYSMGGYGALRFAGALRASSLVAISPQVSIHPSQARWERRYAAEAPGFDPVMGDLARHPAPELAGLILLDPFNRADLRHGRAIAGLFAGMRLVRLGFGGHPASQVIRGSGKRWVIDRATVQPHAPPDLIQRTHREGRRSAPGYWQRLARFCAHRRPALARHALERAEAIIDTRLRATDTPS